jgi:predicted transcriptional regulator of viral defense system
MLSLSKQKIQPLVVADALQEKGIAVFTPQEFSRFFKTSPRQTRYFLETYTKRSFLVRLKKNLYALKMKLPSEEIIANALYKPSYLSLEYVLSRHGIIPESTYSITSVTTRATADFSTLGKEFLYRKIKKAAYTGYLPEKIDGKTIFIAEPEKALIDYLYFVSLGRKTLNSRLDVSRLNKKKALVYAKLYQRKNLKELVEQVWAMTPAVIK